MSRIIKTTLLSIICVQAMSQSPTIFNSDYTVNEKSVIMPKVENNDRIMSQIFFFEREEFSGGFKEKKFYVQNEELFLSLVGEEIYFNPNIIFPVNIDGFYSNEKLTKTFNINGRNGYTQNTPPNFFKVLRAEYEKNGSIKYLLLKKENEPQVPPLYFSPIDFAKTSKLAIGSFSDLGLIQSSRINNLKKQHIGKSYIIKFNDSKTVRIPLETDLPVTISIQKSKLEKDKQRKLRGLGTAYLMTGSPYAILFAYGMQNSYEKRIKEMQYFREKQRRLLYNYDLASNLELTAKDFGPTITWKCTDVKVLEDSSTPVLVLENTKKQKILVVADMINMLMTPEMANEIKTKWGQETFEDLFDGEHETGMPLQMIQFALGYHNYMVSAQQKGQTIEKVYAFDKEWFYFEDDILIKKEWKNYRVESEIFKGQISDAVAK